MNDERELREKGRIFIIEYQCFSFYMITKLSIDGKVEQRREKKKTDLQFRKLLLKYFQVWD